MTKGFGKEPDKEEEIVVESMVASRSLTPAVLLTWGKQQAQLDPATARHHAFSVLVAIAAAELDACLMQWAVKNLEATPYQAAQLLMLFRHRRESNSGVPSVTINIGGEHIRPDTARLQSEQLMYMAFAVEAEALLAAFLLEDLEQTPEIVDQLIQEFRAMRGAVTMWPDEETD